MRLNPELRILMFLDTLGEKPCWLWPLKLNIHGYAEGLINRDPRDPSKGQRHIAMHALAYELLIGPRPKAKHLDHLCHVRHCVNPFHLEPVPQIVNIRRGIWSGGRQRITLDHCINGHAFTPENTYWMNERHRACRQCRREAARRYERTSRRHHSIKLTVAT